MRKRRKTVRDFHGTALGFPRWSTRCGASGGTDGRPSVLAACASKKACGRPELERVYTKVHWERSDAGLPVPCLCHVFLCQRICFSTSRASLEKRSSGTRSQSRMAPRFVLGLKKNCHQMISILLRLFSTLPLPLPLRRPICRKLPEKANPAQNLAATHLPSWPRSSGGCIGTAFRSGFHLPSLALTYTATKTDGSACTHPSHHPFRPLPHLYPSFSAK